MTKDQRKCAWLQHWCFTNNSFFFFFFTAGAQHYCFAMKWWILVSTFGVQTYILDQFQSVDSLHKSKRFAVSLQCNWTGQKKYNKNLLLVLFEWHLKPLKTILCILCETDCGLTFIRDSGISLQWFNSNAYLVLLQPSQTTFQQLTHSPH